MPEAGAARLGIRSGIAGLLVAPGGFESTQVMVMSDPHDEPSLQAFLAGEPTES